MTCIFFFRYDTRGKSFEEARHWSDDQALQGRAFFRGDHEPGRLVLDNVKGEDQVQDLPNKLTRFYYTILFVNMQAFWFSLFSLSKKFVMLFRHFAHCEEIGYLTSSVILIPIYNYKLFIFWNFLGCLQVQSGFQESTDQNIQPLPQRYW